MSDVPNFTVINALGQPMLEKVLLSLYRPVELDLGRLPKGSYFLKIETSDGVAVQKFSLQ
jgi:hypothetical protein